MGNRTALDAVEKHAGYVYFCTDDGTLHFDFEDADGVLQRKQISAKDAETLMGASLATILNSSDLEIPTSKAVLDALENISWNDLEDRPLVMESITITYDGSTDGYVASDPAMLYKVSDLVLTKENVIGQSVSALVAGSMNTTIITEDEITPLEDPRSFILGGVVACIAEDNTIYNGSITFPEKGVYFYSNSGAHVTSLGVANAAEVFDEKYIPSTIARKEDIVQSDWSESNESSLSYVKNKTHYYCEGSTIVKETSITVTNENFTTLNPYITFEEGKKYKVVIDGVQDICTAVHIDDAAAGENCIELTPTIEGFGVVRSRLSGGICTYVSGVSLGDHVISIYEDNELKQLDEMFIPDTIARTADVAAADWSVNDETSAAYIKNRTHWVETEYVTFIDNETIEFLDAGEGHIGEYADENVVFIDGNTYTFVIDDVTYECVAHIFEDYSYTYIGNLGLLDPGLEDTLEPFCIVCYNKSEISTMGLVRAGLMIATTLEGNSHVISLSGLNTVYHKIDKMYLPYLAGQKGSEEGAEIFNDYSGDNVASGGYSHAEGQYTTASGWASHAEGSNTTASSGYTHAEGNATTASGMNSHAEGKETTASGYISHAEGYQSVASGGYGSHAEGYLATASGNNAHAEGYNTVANSQSQHVQGQCNIIDTSGDAESRGKYAHIVGNGTSDTDRSNAHTLDWDGLGWFASGVKVGGTGQDDENAKELATQEYVVEQILAMLAARKPKIATVELAADAWVSEGNLHSQVVEIDGVTPNSQVDLTPSVEQLVIFYEKDLGFVTENEDGVVTVYAIGQKPENDYTIQVTITEVSV